MNAGEAVLYAFATLFILAIVIIAGVPFVNTVLGKIVKIEEQSGGNMVRDVQERFTQLAPYLPLVAGGAVFLGLLLWAIRRIYWGTTYEAL